MARSSATAGLAPSAMQAVAASSSPLDSSKLESNLTAVRERIARAAVRSGREPGDVQLVAVTKTVDSSVVQRLHGLGQVRFGENRVDELRRKVESLSQADPRPQFDLIGTLQTNKVRHVVGVAGLIHSVDSVRLLEAIHARALGVDVAQDVLLQVNVSGEGTKHGIQPIDLSAVLSRAGELSAESPSAGVRVVGLMTMAPNLPVEQVRWVFTRLRTIRDEALVDLPNGVQLAQLSMGMSNDFEVAVEEGATLVRVGSSLFQE